MPPLGLQALLAQSVSVQSTLPSQSSSAPLAHEVSVGSVSAQAQAPFWQSFCVPHACPAQEGSAQSMRPSQSSSTPLAQLVSVRSTATAPPSGRGQQNFVAPEGLPAHAWSAQSVAPLQSLSRPSPQSSGPACTAPPSLTTQHVPPRHLFCAEPHDFCAQSGSAQSVRPSQSSSTPSEQLSSIWAPASLLAQLQAPGPVQRRPKASQVLPRQS